MGVYCGDGLPRQRGSEGESPTHGTTLTEGECMMESYLGDCRSSDEAGVCRATAKYRNLAWLNWSATEHISHERPAVGDEEC